MSLEQTSIIDFIATHRESGDVTLVLSDDHDWTDEELHLNLLQDKLNSYVEFIESGQIVESHPNAKSHRVKIEIVFRYDPTAQGDSLLKDAAEVLSDAGIPLVWRHSTPADG